MRRHLLLLFLLLNCNAWYISAAVDSREESKYNKIKGNGGLESRALQDVRTPDRKKAPVVNKLALKLPRKAYTSPTQVPTIEGSAECQDDPDFTYSGILPDGQFLNCTTFGRFENMCGDYGNRTDVNGLTGDEGMLQLDLHRHGDNLGASLFLLLSAPFVFLFSACCACGGKDNGVDDTCTNDPDFTYVGTLLSGDLLDCDTFARPELFGICGRFGILKDKNGLSPNEGEFQSSFICNSICWNWKSDAVFPPMCFGKLAVLVEERTMG